MTGYVGLFRCLLEKPIWKNSTPEQKTILITLLLMVNHHEAQWEWKGEKFKVMPGQTVTSLDKIMDACGKGISIQNVRSALTKLEKLEFLTNESTKTGRLITIVNWGLYQVNLLQGNKDINKELTKNQQSTNKEVTPNKNDKKVNNEKTIVYTHDFLEWYSIYPNSFNKEQSSKNWEKTTKTVSKEKILLATNEYIRILKSQNKLLDKEHITRSSNFVGNNATYKGYLEKVEEKEITIKPFKIIDV